MSACLLPPPNRMPLGWDVSPRWAAGLRCRSPRSSVTRCVRPCTSRTPRGAGSLATLGLATRQALHWDTLAFRTTPRRRSVCATRPERADASRPIRRRATSPPAEVSSPWPGIGLLRRLPPPGASRSPHPYETPALWAVLIRHRPKHRAAKVVPSRHGSPSQRPPTRSA